MTSFFFKWKTSYFFFENRRLPQLFENGRRPDFFWKWKTTWFFLKMEDDRIFFLKMEDFLNCFSSLIFLKCYKFYFMDLLWQMEPKDVYADCWKFRKKMLFSLLVIPYPGFQDIYWWSWNMFNEEVFESLLINWIKHHLSGGKLQDLVVSRIIRIWYKSLLMFH